MDVGRRKKRSAYDHRSVVVICTEREVVANISRKLFLEITAVANIGAVGNAPVKMDGIVVC